MRIWHLLPMCKIPHFNAHADLPSGARILRCVLRLYCGRPWPAAYIMFKQNTHQIQAAVRSKAVVLLLLIFCLLLLPSWESVIDSFHIVSAHAPNSLVPRYFREITLEGAIFIRLPMHHIMEYEERRKEK